MLLRGLALGPKRRKAKPDDADLLGVMSPEYPASGVLAGGACDDLEYRPSGREAQAPALSAS